MEQTATALAATQTAAGGMILANLLPLLGTMVLAAIAYAITGAQL